MQIAKIGGLDRILNDHDDGGIKATILYMSSYMDYLYTTPDYADDSIMTNDQMFEAFMNNGKVLADLGSGNTGYLSVVAYSPEGRLHVLFPNEEVRSFEAVDYKEPEPSQPPE